LLEIDKEEKRLAVLEACDQEHLMRQEGEDLGSGGDSGDQAEDRDREGQLDQDQDEYSDSRSAAVDEVIYHRLLDSLDVIRGERDRIRDERNRNLEALASIEVTFWTSSRRRMRNVDGENEEYCWRTGRSSLTVTIMLTEVVLPGGRITRGWIWVRCSARHVRV